ncbi:MAG: uracil-DNA glycosylase [Oligoflexia bacterium]|nr:uracil-DNA glycosylase [Oligoflexia bacterium]
MGELQKMVSKCFECKLSKTRTNTVFGSGNTKARLMFIGEGPGADEDAQGLPFVGRAGQLLTKMIEAMGLKREEVYIANVVKCRPPENRKPQGDEVGACENYLFSQIAKIKPELMIALGATAMECLLKTEEKIGEKRGKVMPFLNTKLLITYHPAYLLRNPPAKKYVWDDLKVAMKELGLKGS